jgi:hypothetical protein|nr:MAG TPA: hypothetical protein [Caudoviricetes sp.]
MKKKEFLNKKTEYPHMGFKSDDIIIRFSKLEDYERAPFIVNGFVFDIVDNGSGNGWGKSYIVHLNSDNSITYPELGITRVSREGFLKQFDFSPRDSNSDISKIEIHTKEKMSENLSDFGCENGELNFQNIEYDTSCIHNEINKAFFKKETPISITLTYHEYKKDRENFVDSVRGLKEIVFPNFKFI